MSTPTAGVRIAPTTISLGLQRVTWESQSCGNVWICLFIYFPSFSIASNSLLSGGKAARRPKQQGPLVTLAGIKV